MATSSTNIIPARGVKKHMHRDVKILLEEATGVSEFVIAVNFDIRGFSAFSMKVESAESAIFVKKVYKKLIDLYFPDSAFFKLTGDGLLLVLPYTEENLAEVSSKTLTSCIKVLREFPSFCKNDPMINFQVPDRVGFGLSRGAACRLVSGDKTLDYSGRVLNLASRLMDLARPSGLVFDMGFGLELVPEELKDLFEKDRVYIRGIVERSPIEIFYTKDYTTISPRSREPFEKIT